MGRCCLGMGPSLHLGLREQAAWGSGGFCLPLVSRVRGADCPRRQVPVGMTFPLPGPLGLWSGCRVWALWQAPRPNPSVPQFLSGGISGSLILFRTSELGVTHLSAVPRSRQRSLCYSRKPRLAAAPDGWVAQPTTTGRGEAELDQSPTV